MDNIHIYEEIGKGKYSFVYKARKKKTIEYIAIKSIEKLKRSKVENEVKTLHNLSHPSIIKFYNWYETKNHLWMVYEYCSGGDLFSLMEIDKTFPENVIQYFASDILSALFYLHCNGILQCDLKPANILITENANLKIYDFGQTKFLNDINKNKSKIMKDKKGSPYYMAPELFEDAGPYSFQSDLWSLGILLYELAVGTPPFDENEFQQLMKQIITQNVPFIQNMSNNFNDLIQKLLNKNPVQRLSWPEILSHPFFKQEILEQSIVLQQLETINLPQQTYFQQWASKRYKIQVSIDENNKENKNILGNQNNNINFLRISQTVKANLLNEIGQMYQQSQKDNQKANNEIKLHNRNQEINMAQDANIENEDIASSNQFSQQSFNSEYNEVDAEYNEHEQQLLQLPKNQTFKKSQNQHAQQKRQKGKKIQQTKKPETSTGASRMKPQQQILDTPNILQHQRPISTPSSQDKQIDKIRPMDELNWINFDNQVTPIYGNQQIEKYVEPQYDKKVLGYQAFTLEQICSSIDSPEIDQHFVEIYNLLNQPMNSNIQSQNKLLFEKKLQTLNYLDTIIQNSPVANRLINSMFIKLLIKICQVTKSINHKTRVCSILGGLIRHTTFIEIDLNQIGLQQTLCDCLKDKSDKVRKKAIAALGEYLFYASTQLDEAPQENEIWKIHQTTILSIMKALRPQEDDIVKFYTVKSIENILSNSVHGSILFSTIEFFDLIFQIYISTKNENLKIECNICLLFITRLNNHFQSPLKSSIYAIEKFTLKHISSILKDGNQKIQATFICLLNFAFTSYTENKNQEDYSTIEKLSKSILSEQNFIKRIMNLLEQNNETSLKGKLLLLITNLLKFSPSALQQISGTKFFILLDRILQEQTEGIDGQSNKTIFLTDCFLHLVSQLEIMMPTLLNIIKDELEEIIQTPIQSQQQIKLILVLLNILFQIVNTQKLKFQFVGEIFIKFLYNYFELSEKVKDQQCFDIKSLIFMILETLASSVILIQTNQHILIHFLLPNLIQKLDHQNTDIKFNFLKIFGDFISQIIIEKIQLQQVQHLVSSQFYPKIKLLLNDQNPIPLQCYKILNVLFENNPQYFVVEFFKIDGLQIIMKQLNQQSITGIDKIPLVILNTIESILQCKQITLEEFEKFQFTEILIKLFGFFYQYNQDSSFDVLFGIIEQLIYKIDQKFSLSPRLNNFSLQQNINFPLEFKV